jgi:type I restriction enzyme S subunit
MSLQSVIGPVPEHWEIRPFFATGKTVKSKNNAMREDNLLSLSYGRIVEKDIDSSDGLLPESFETYQIVHPNDMVFRFTDLQNDQRSLRSALVRDQGIITSAYLAFRPYEQVIVPKFLDYLMRAYDLSKVFYPLGGGVRQSLKFDDVKRLGIIVPPLVEQKAIVDFLDRELEQIDALIAKQVELIEVLVERRQSLITNVVGNSTLAKNLGLTSSTDDGKWSQTPLKYLTQLNPGVLSEDTNEDLMIDYIEIGGVDLANGIFESTEVLFKDAPSRARRLVTDSDVLVSTVRTYLKAVGQVQASMFNNTIVASTGFAVLRPTRINADFLLYAATSDAFVSEVEARSTGVSYPGISASELVKISIPVPPIETQRLISQYLSEQLLDIKQAIENSVKLKELLKERRQSIISAAVTGKIDVRKVA